MRFDCGVAGDLEQTNCLNLAIGELGRGNARARESRSRCMLGIDGIAFSDEPSLAFSRWSRDFLDFAIETPKKPGEARAIRAAALNTEGMESTQRLSPC